MHTYQEALNLILAESKSFGVEKIGLESAIGRVMAQNITADRDYPPFNRAAMDGFCFQVWGNEILTSYKCVGVIFAGNSTHKLLEKGECFKIMTGAAVPYPANCVIRVEDAIESDGVISFLTESVKPFQNIATQGEDLKNGALVKTEGGIINGSLYSILASLGQNEIEVFKLPKVAIVSTGNEIRPVSAPVSSFQIRDSNSYTIASSLAKYKIKPNFKCLVRDEKIELLAQISKALGNDIVIISGGVSAGDADFIPQILIELGAVKIFHKAKMKPGKPIWFGKGTNGQLIFALPGNPFSVQVACRVFIEPFLRKCFSLDPENALWLPLALEKKKKVALDEFYPCKLTRSVATKILPLVFNGSGDVTAGLGSDGIAIHPIFENDMEKDRYIKFLAW